MNNSLRFAFGMLAVAISLTCVIPASAANVKVRNCLKERVFVCAYNSHDNAFTIVAESGGVQPGQRKGFKCSTNRCKVFVGVSDKTVASTFTAELVPAAITGGAVLGAPVGGGVALAVGASEMAAYTAVGTSTAVVAGAIIGVVVGLDALSNAKKCKAIIRKARKDDLKMKTSHNFSVVGGVVDDQLALALMKGADACPAE